MSYQELCGSSQGMHESKRESHLKLRALLDNCPVMISGVRDEERPGERGLSFVQRDASGQAIGRVCLRDCKRCQNAFLQSA